jgi:hypothetical protein
MELTTNVHFLFTINVSMELVDACSNALGVEDVTSHDVEPGNFCPILVEHLKVNPLHVFISPIAENETRLARVSCMDDVNEMDSFWFYPHIKFVLQESATTFSFANYSCQEIATTLGYVNEALHSKLVLQEIAMISCLVNDNCQDVTTSSFP